MAKGQAPTCIKLRARGFPAHVFAPRHFAGILGKMRSGNMVMLADFGAAEPGEIALRLVCAGAIRAIGLAVIDPLHLERGMKIVPSPRFVRMDGTPAGDAPPNDRDGLGLIFYHSCQGLAFPLPHHHDTAALAVLGFAPADPRGAMIFRPDMAAEPGAINLDGSLQSGRGGTRRQGAPRLVQ